VQRRQVALLLLSNDSFCINCFVISREVISGFTLISLVWVLLEFYSTGKISGIANCLGALAGLVGITPGSGYVDPWSAIIIGGLTATICFFAMSQKRLTGIDDSLDVFAVHGVGGNIIFDILLGTSGMILCAIFYRKWIPLMDGAVMPGGVIEGNWIQLGYHVAAIVVIALCTFIT
jgi:Amt family ammonium transporter